MSMCMQKIHTHTQKRPLPGEFHNIVCRSHTRPSFSACLGLCRQHGIMCAAQASTPVTPKGTGNP